MTLECNKAGLEIGDIVVKEVKKNISHKGGRLKREKEFFAVEGILDNGNIQLRSWNKNEIEHKTVPPQQ